MNQLDNEFSRAHEAEKFLKSISNPHKLLILCSIMKSPGVSNGEISNICGTSISSTSQYLVSLVELDFIERVKKGKETQYFIKDDRVIQILSLLKKLF